jgi:hypothetical protein
MREKRRSDMRRFMSNNYGLLVVFAMVLFMALGFGAMVACAEEPEVAFSLEAYREIEKKYVEHPSIFYPYKDGLIIRIFFEMGHKGEKEFEVARFLGYPISLVPLLDYLENHGHNMALQRQAQRAMMWRRVSTPEPWRDYEPKTNR